MVLASKLGSPVSFQQDKNFHQSFATWVKQGQTNNGSGEQEEGEGCDVLFIPIHCHEIETGGQTDVGICKKTSWNKDI